MKLARFDAGNGPTIGVVKEGGIVALPETGFPILDVLAIVGGNEELLDRLKNTVELTSPHHALADVRLLAPLRPGKYLAIGMNYRKHMVEAGKLGVEEPKKQFWFNKQTTCITGPYDDVAPGVSTMLDYEVELGVVIGRVAKGVSADAAHAHIFGYVVVNDVSARDWQFHSPTFTVGKSFDTHGPIGPWIVTADEVDDVHNLDLRCLINGECRQSSNTSEMIYNVYQQIEYLSTAFTLEAGDLLATGTPEGVGIAMTPQTFLRSGDLMRCEIDGIGAIENRIAR